MAAARFNANDGVWLSPTAYHRFRFEAWNLPTTYIMRHTGPFGLSGGLFDFAMAQHPAARRCCFSMIMLMFLVLHFDSTMGV